MILYIKEKRKKQGFFSKIMSVLFGPDEEEDDTRLQKMTALAAFHPKIEKS